MNNIFTNLPEFLLAAEQSGLITRTFRRLDAERQQAVILALLEEAGQGGPLAINIKQVAQRSGVAVGSMYQYFGDREHLIQFALTLVVRETVAAFSSYTEMLAQLPLREAITAYLGGGIEWTQAQLGMARTFAKAAYQGDEQLAESVVKPIAEVLTGMMRAILQAAQARGEIRRDLNLEVVTRLLNTHIIAIGDAQLFPHLNHYYQLYNDHISPEIVLESLFDLLENGLKPDSSV